MLTGIQVLCFDLDNTFWDLWPVMARAEAAVDAWLRAHHPRIAQRCSIDVLREARQALARAEPALAHDVTALRIESLARLARELGESPEIGVHAFEVFLAVRNQVVLYDDVRPALQALGRRFRLATFSNGNADLRHIGLASHFELCLSAREAGAAKPDVRAFAALLRALDAAPGEVAYVGDDPHADVAGARAAGLRSVWLNRGVIAWPDELARADLDIETLTQL